MVVCDALVVAVVTVGLAVEWPLWAIGGAAVLPLVVGVVAARAAYVLSRHGGRPAPG